MLTFEDQTFKVIIMRIKFCLLTALFSTITCFGQSSITLFNRAVYKYENLDYKGAIEDYTKVIERNNKDAKAYLSRGLAKYFLQDFEGAIEDQNKAIEIDPKIC